MTQRSSGPPRRPRFPATLPSAGLPRPAVKVSAPQRPAVRTLEAIPAQATGLGLDSSAVRLALIRRLAAQPGMAEPVLQVMSRIERHRFVEPALVNQAYEDTSLPIGFGQTISKPGVVARMLSLLGQGRDQGRLGKVLEIGTGCGYQAAVLSGLSTQVISIERIKGLHEKARSHIRGMGLHNLHLILADGMLGYAPGGPYDTIISAAGGDDIPQAWLSQLAMGGKLIAPCTMQTGEQALVLVERTPAGDIRQVFEAVRFVPLKSGTA
mgnify:FL=1